MKNKLPEFLILFLLLPNLFFGQKQKNINLASLNARGKLQAVNRTINAGIQNDTAFIHVIENKGEGIIWLPIKKLTNGTIEIQMRGKDVFKKSFLGIAFHGKDDTTYDAVYCRPANFFAKDSIIRTHAIQYVSHPLYTWKKLREDQNAKFEKEIINPPDPNGWFTMKLVIDNIAVKAFINDFETPSLIVKKLNDRSTGKIGLFTGDGSGGDFKTIKIVYIL